MINDVNSPIIPIGLSRRQWVYAEMLRIERHWTDQVQNQQRRIAAVLAVNGFLLAFLSTAGLQLRSDHLRGWYFYPFYGCLIVLSIALVFGVLTLFPQISIAGGRGNDRHPKGTRRDWIHDTFFKEVPTDVDSLWLNAKSVWQEMNRDSSEINFDRTLEKLCQSIAGAMGNFDHTKTITRRRKWMNWQILLIMISLVLLIIAIAGQAVHVL